MTVTISLKSITQIRLSSKTVIFFLITIIISSKLVAADDSRIMNELPKADDLDSYVTTLEKIIEFVVKHRVYVDLNFDFGLFLINANLKTLMDMKSPKLPTKLRLRLEQLLLKNENVQEYYRDMVRKTDHDDSHHTAILIHQLFYNETTWPINLPRLNDNLLPNTKLYTAEQLTAIYGNWDVYVDNVNDFDKYIPSPMKSDFCTSQLALSDNPHNRYYQTKSKVPKCRIPDECRMAEGSEFGYAFSHRILYLILAHITRNCVVFDRRRDRAMLDQHCSRTFIEAQFIVLNDYQLPDLLLEQITLCSLSGYVQFLQRSWLSKLQEFQTNQGCFASDKVIAKANMHMEEGIDEHWQMEKTDHVIMGGGCNAHVTAVAAGTFSLATRYIMEKFY